MRCFRVAHLASTHDCRMRRKRLIRPTVQAQVCRPDKTRKRRIRQWCSDAGCGVNALSGLRFRHKFVGLIRRVSVASGNGARMPDAACTPYPAYEMKRCFGLTRPFLHALHGVPNIQPLFQSVPILPGCACFFQLPKDQPPPGGLAKNRLWYQKLSPDEMPSQ